MVSESKAPASTRFSIGSRLSPVRRTASATLENFLYCLASTMASACAFPMPFTFRNPTSNASWVESVPEITLEIIHFSTLMLMSGFRTVTS